MPRIIKPAKGTFSTADITVDSSGRIVAASDGSAGGLGAVITQLDLTGPASGTYTAQPGTSSAFALMGSGGGGGGEAMPANVGGNAGDGAFGLYKITITQPYSQPYSVGAAGQGGDYDGVPKNAGGDTTIANVGTVTGGGSGGGAGPQNPGNDGNPGSAPGTTNTVTLSTYQGKTLPTGGNRGNTPRGGGNDGGAGFLMVFEDS